MRESQTSSDVQLEEEEEEKKKGVYPPAREAPQRPRRTRSRGRDRPRSRLRTSTQKNAHISWVMLRRAYPSIARNNYELHETCDKARKESKKNEPIRFVLKTTLLCIEVLLIRF